MELCSLQGSDDYTRLVRQPELNVLDFLNTFPSCHPPIERLLEQLPRLLARPYSLSSSPLQVRDLI
jgi:sulfite reductase alpha subunit-like flavoprotein